MRSSFFAFEGRGKRESSKREKTGEAAETAPSLETDVYSVHLRSGKSGGSRGGQLGLTVSMVLTQPRQGWDRHHIGKGRTDMTEVDLANIKCL